VLVNDATYHRDRANKYLTWLIGIALLFAWTKVTEYRNDRSFLPQESKVAVYEKTESNGSFQCLDGQSSGHGSRICQVIGTSYDTYHSDAAHNKDCFTTSFLVSNPVMTNRALTPENGFAGDIHEVTQCGSFIRLSPGQSLYDWEFEPSKSDQSVFSLLRNYVEKLDRSLLTAAEMLKAPHTKCQRARLSVKFARNHKASASPVSGGSMSFTDYLIATTIVNAPRGCFTTNEVNKARVTLKKH